MGTSQTIMHAPYEDFNRWVCALNPTTVKPTTSQNCQIKGSGCGTLVSAPACQPENRKVVGASTVGYLAFLLLTFLTLYPQAGLFRVFTYNGQ